MAGHSRNCTPNSSACSTPPWRRGITPSAVCAVAVDGERLPVVTAGDAVRFGADGVELPEDQRTAADAGTYYDLASVTKVFTAVTALALVDSGVPCTSTRLSRYRWADPA